MRLLFPTNETDSPLMAAWAAMRIPHMNGQGFGPCSAIGWATEEGGMAGVAVYHNHQPQYGNIEMSFVVANPHTLNRHLLSALLRYPFAQLGVKRITVITPSSETTSVWRFLEKFGFQHEGRVRKGLGDDDALIWGLLQSEWVRHRYNVDRVEKRRRRRRRGTLTLEGHALH